MTATADTYTVVPHREQYVTGSAAGQIVHILDAWRLVGPGGPRDDDPIRFGDDGQQTLQREADRLNVGLAYSSST